MEEGVNANGVSLAFLLRVVGMGVDTTPEMGQLNAGIDGVGAGVDAAGIGTDKATGGGVAPGPVIAPGLSPSSCFPNAAPRPPPGMWARVVPVRAVRTMVVRVNFMLVGWFELV